MSEQEESGGGWGLDALCDFLDKDSERKHEEAKALTENLGKPDITDEISERAYWRIDGSVVSYRFHATGVVIRHSRIEYTAQFISMLASLLKQEETS